MTATPEGNPTPRRPRSVPTIYGLVSLVLVALALTFALSSPPPTTPPLAAVAPAPQEQVEVERVEQSSRFGEGGGSEDSECVPGDEGCEGGGEHELERPDAVQPEVVESSAAGELRHCPRAGRTQTDDPQSPPCIAEIFDGDNGGATWQGVTATTIRIAVPWNTKNDEDPAVRPAVEALARHFDQEYELYGRSIELVFVEPSTNTSGAEGRRAWARDVVATEPFASLEPGTVSSGDLAFYQTVTGTGIVATLGDRAQTSASVPNLTTLPHVWSVFPTSDEALRVSGDVVCRTLAGRPASHGGEEVADVIRRFGVLQLEDDGERVDASPLTSRLDACGAPYGEYVATWSDNDSIRATLRLMRRDGITTVICACTTLQKNVPHRADELGWEPEWFHPGTNDEAISNGTTSGLASMPHSQVQHMFGISAQLRRPLVTAGAERERYEEQFWYHALLDVAPDTQLDGLTRARTMYSYYAQLLVLASGIQWAGPELTPDSFREALDGLRFANPDVGTAPWYQPSVGFGATDRALNSDYAAFWWDAPPVADGNFNKAGRMCYVGGGTRYVAGTFPDDLDDRLFDPEAGCR